MHLLRARGGSALRHQVPLNTRPAQLRRVAASVAKKNGDGGPHLLNFDELADVLRLVESTDIVELELKSKRFNLAVRKKEALKALEPVYQAPPPPPPQFYNAPMTLPLPAAAPAAAPALTLAAAPALAVAAAPLAAPKAAAPGGVEITSPMSGTFYRLPGPGEPPFVKEGDMVKKGQTVGVIEAMKLMNEIEAEISGEVIKFCIENGKSVTIGQALLIVRAT